MQTRIEPPVLLSRITTFVFAAAAVMVGVLAFTLYNLFPLNRPQIFFLMTQPRNNLEITLTEMPPQNANLDGYKRAFIREYIKARNEIVPNISAMRKKWSNDENAAVRMWSTPDVYNDFMQTNMWSAFMNDASDFDFSCPVEFPSGAIAPRANNTYAISFSYYCTNSNGQANKKDYTIVVTLDTEDNTKLKWSDRLNNPLGIRVSEYKIESGPGDPLDTGYINTSVR